MEEESSEDSGKENNTSSSHSSESQLDNHDNDEVLETFTKDLVDKNNLLKTPNILRRKKEVLRMKNVENKGNKGKKLWKFMRSKLTRGFIWTQKIKKRGESPKTIYQQNKLAVDSKNKEILQNDQLIPLRSS